MSQNKNIRCYIILTLVAFLLSALLPFFAVYNLPQNITNDTNLTRFAGNSILICTENGFKLVTLDDLKNNKEHPKPHPKYRCPLCYLAAHGLKHSLNTTHAFILAPKKYTKLSWRPITASKLQKTTTIYTLSRAPPAYIAT